MVIVPANEQSEAGELPGEDVLGPMTTYNEELARAGVMLDGSGLRPTSDGARVKFEAGKATVIDGPFTESKELIAGYWLFQAKDLDEAVEWVKRAPFRQFTEQGGEVQIEIRQLYELSDFEPSPALDRAMQLQKQMGQG
jgi:hypothetical protein